MNFDPIQHYLKTRSTKFVFTQNGASLEPLEVGGFTVDEEYNPIISRFSTVFSLAVNANSLAFCAIGAFIERGDARLIKYMHNKIEILELFQSQDVGAALKNYAFQNGWDYDAHQALKYWIGWGIKSVLRMERRKNLLSSILIGEALKKWESLLIEREARESIKKENQKDATKRVLDFVLQQMKDPDTEDDFGEYFQDMVSRVCDNTTITIQEAYNQAKAKVARTRCQQRETEYQDDRSFEHTLKQTTEMLQQYQQTMSSTCYSLDEEERDGLCLALTQGARDGFVHGHTDTEVIESVIAPTNYGPPKGTPLKRRHEVAFKAPEPKKVESKAENYSETVCEIQEPQTKRFKDMPESLGMIAEEEELTPLLYAERALGRPESITSAEEQHLQGLAATIIEDNGSETTTEDGNEPGTSTGPAYADVSSGAVGRTDTVQYSDSESEFD